MNEYERVDLINTVRSETMLEIKEAIMHAASRIGLLTFVSFFVILAGMAKYNDALTIIAGLLTTLGFMAMMALMTFAGWLQSRWIDAISEGIRERGEINCRAADESIAKTQDVLEKLNSGAES